MNLFTRTRKHRAQQIADAQERLIRATEENTTARLAATAALNHGTGQRVWMENYIKQQYGTPEPSA